LRSGISWFEKFRRFLKVESFMLTIFGRLEVSRF